MSTYICNDGTVVHTHPAPPKPRIFLLGYLKASPVCESFAPNRVHFAVDRLITLRSLGLSNWTVAFNGKILLNP
jgi:hypothetical protein